MTSSDTDLSGLDLLHQRHEEIKTLFDQLLDAQPAEREELFDCLRATLAAHEVVEEMYVHPLVRDMGPDAERIAEARLKEEAEATQTLSGLEDLGVDGDQFTTRLVMFRHAVIAHAEAEEREVFPLLQSGCSQKDLAALADSILVSEQLAPTHAHPHASQNPIALMLTGPFVAMVDKVRDHLKSVLDN